MNNGKRLVIYFFYDKDGIADRYMDYFLKELNLVTDKFIIVSNGAITAKTRKIFLKYSEDIIVRKNEGLDVWAYKEALEYEGWDELKNYHEVCLVNSTIMGPVYPFKEMFDTMDQRKEIDFWGINRYLRIDANPFNNPYGYLPEHIQSHFMVYRNKFLQTKELRNYWKNIPQINSYSDSVGKHESYFTKFFADQGFIWTTFVNSKIEENYNNYYLMFDPVNCIKKYRCPIFKRKLFFLDQNDTLRNVMGEHARKLFDYLKENTKYDTDMILENIIRTCNQSDLVRTLGLYYVLPSRGGSEINELKNNASVALIMHLYYDDLIEESLHYAAAMPENADIYITTPHQKLADEIKIVFSALKNKVFIRVIENRGRDISALLVGAKDVVNIYDYICFYHDKKTTQVKPFSVGRSFAFKCSECALHNKTYVENIIKLLSDNHRLGLLTNLPPNHDLFSSTIGSEWGANYDNTVKLMKILDINAPISIDKPPIAPLGTVFWFKSKSLMKLFRKNWEYKDFPIEPNENDGTLLHAIERIYPFVVQDAGYYSAYVMPDFLASREINNLYYYYRDYNNILKKHGILVRHCEGICFIDNLLEQQLELKFLLKFFSKRCLKKILPSDLYNLCVKIYYKLFK